MSDVRSDTTDISEQMTWHEICLRYPDEWVVLVEIDWVNDTDFDFRSARVAGHGKTRKAPLEQARPFQASYPSMGHFFTGRVRAPIVPLFYCDVRKPGSFDRRTLAG